MNSQKLELKECYRILDEGTNTLAPSCLIFVTGLLSILRDSSPVSNFGLRYFLTPGRIFIFEVSRQSGNFFSSFFHLQLCKTVLNYTIQTDEEGMNRIQYKKQRNISLMSIQPRDSSEHATPILATEIMQ